jgi:Putative motility protein
MDLVSAAVNMQQANLIGQVQILVARKILDSEQEQGSAAVELIDAASSGVDQAGNALVAATTGLGGQLDVTA